MRQQLLPNRGKDDAWRNRFHADGVAKAALSGGAGIVAWRTPELVAKDDSVWRGGSAESWIGWAVHYDDRCLDGTGNVHRPTITCDQHIALRQYRDQLRKRCFPTDIEKWMSCSAGNIAREWRF